MAEVSFLKAGLVYSAALNTVSPTYAREIQSPEHGCGLDGLLRARAALTGILNGIDADVWDPARDPPRWALQHRRSSGKGKEQAGTTTTARPGGERRLPPAGLRRRLTHQKGADLIAAAAAELVGLHAQLAVLGRGERDIEAALSAVAARHPGRVAVATSFDEPLAHLIEAGADVFLMPSRFEPCGLNQMYSQRYGTPPVARATGGLVDTVIDGETGFLFERAGGRRSRRRCAARSPYGASQPAGAKSMRAGMQRDFGWRVAARQYADLYSRLCQGSGVLIA